VLLAEVVELAAQVLLGGAAVQVVGEFVLPGFVRLFHPVGLATQRGDGGVACLYQFGESDDLRLAADDGESRKAEHGFAAAAATFREFGMPFWLAVTLTEHGEWFVSEDRAGEAEPMLTEARETFERLGAKPWLARLESTEARPREELSV
jgi:hypothetical protein